jgi:hypothetical protein
VSAEPALGAGPPEPPGGSPWGDLALLGWGRAVSGGLLGLALVAAPLMPLTRGPTELFLGIAALVGWRGGVGALAAMVGLAFACWRARWTARGAVLGLLVGLPVLLVTVDGLLLSACFASEALAREALSAHAVASALGDLQEAAGGVAEYPLFFAGLLAQGVLPGLIVFAVHAGRRGRPWVAWPARMSLALALAVRIVLWLVLLAAAGFDGDGLGLAMVFALIECGVSLGGAAAALGLAAPARRALAARASLPPANVA